MRSKQQLLAFHNLTKLLQYLYLGDTITITNAIQVRLTIRMNPETCGFEVRNENFPELGFCPFTEQMTVPVLFDIIEQLKTQPAERPASFRTRWDEIKTITDMNVSLNQHKLEQIQHHL